MTSRNAADRDAPAEEPLRTPPVHRLKHENNYHQERHAICGAVERTRKGERLNFTIDPGDVTCPSCSPVDTGAICPARKRWWHRKSREHVGEWRSVDVGNCRTGPCVFCGRSVQQRLSYGGKPRGPWIDTVWLPCAHGRGGVPVPSCMNCANARSVRGLYR